MTDRHPRLAAALLHALDADDTMIGDLLEEYGHRRSNMWLWKQVTVAVVVTLSGRGRTPRVHQPRAINLGVAPRGSSVGGFGLVGIAVLITLVAPHAWWLFAIALAGGVVLGVALIAVRHRQSVQRQSAGHRTIFLPLLLLCTSGVFAATPPVQLLPPAARVDPIEGIAEAFRTHQVVMLPGGHGSKLAHELLLSLARDSRLHGVLTDIVVEFGGSRHQDVIDRYMRGDDIPYDVLKHAWQDTAIPSFTNDGPYVEEFYREMRALNASLPAGRRIRVLGGDPPIDWSHVANKADLRKWTVLRSTYPADLIRREVVARGRRALVVYGHLHFPRKEIVTNYDMSDWQSHTMTSWLEVVPGTRVFVIMSEGGQDIVKLQPDIATWPRHSLATIRGTRIGAADYARFNGDNGDRYVIRGIESFEKIPVQQHRSMRMEDQLDAILWNGNAPPQPMLLSAETCADPAYVPMRLGRIALAGLPAAEAEAVNRACAVHK